MSSLFFMMTYEVYMRRCIELAAKAAGRTYPNPMVGSVIVHQDKIIGEGYHKKAGEPHAEINAINSVKDLSLLKESTLYVSLEPCAHYGRTPPCAAKIAELGIPRVVIGAMDPHSKVNGKGKKILEDAGINVTTGILDNECAELNKRFFTFQQKKRPYIILKWAQSADGYVDKAGKPVQIGNPLTKQFVHSLRATENAILIGTQTALNDNPSLTTREISGPNPVRIVIDFDLKVPTDFSVFNGEAPTLVFNLHKSGTEGSTRYIQASRDDFINEMLPQLYEIGIQSVLVEGGSLTLQKFIQQNLWDEALILENPTMKLVSGTAAPFLDIKNRVTVQKFTDNTISFYKNSDAG